MLLYAFLPIVHSKTIENIVNVFRNPRSHKPTLKRCVFKTMPLLSFQVFTFGNLLECLLFHHHFRLFCCRDDRQKLTHPRASAFLRKSALGPDQEDSKFPFNSVQHWEGGGGQGGLNFPLLVPFNPGSRPISVGSVLF